MSGAGVLDLFAVGPHFEIAAGLLIIGSGFNRFFHIMNLLSYLDYTEKIEILIGSKIIYQPTF